MARHVPYRRKAGIVNPIGESGFGGRGAAIESVVAAFTF